MPGAMPCSFLGFAAADEDKVVSEAFRARLASFQLDEGPRANRT